MKRVIIAPHCDDESFACGGLLAKYPEDSAVLVLAEADPIREKEFEQARKILGYTKSINLGFKDGYVGDDMHSLVRRIDAALLEWKPEELYIPFPSAHQDHVAGYEAGLRSARLSMNSAHWFPPSVYVYDVPVYDVSLYPSNLSWNVFESLTKEQVEKKAEALESYISQHIEGPHPCNLIREAAYTIGASRALEFAEQYALIREVRT